MSPPAAITGSGAAGAEASGRPDVGSTSCWVPLCPAPDREIELVGAALCTAAEVWKTNEKSCRCQFAPWSALKNPLPEGPDGRRSTPTRNAVGRSWSSNWGAVLVRTIAYVVPAARTGGGLNVTSVEG